MRYIELRNKRVLIWQAVTLTLRIVANQFTHYALRDGKPVSQFRWANFTGPSTNLRGRT